jgi:diguanylate cyclase (GGDEF)-like protein/PAS domain S-box-containing protein
LSELTGLLRSIAARVAVGAAAAGATAAGLHYLNVGPWAGAPGEPLTHLTPFLAVIVIAGLCVALDSDRSTDSGSLRLPFLACMVALPLCGQPAALVAGLGTLACVVLHPPRPHPLRRAPLEVAAAIVAAGAAWLAYSSSLKLLPGGGWLGLSVLAATTAYSVMVCAVADISRPLVGDVFGTEIRRWPARGLRGFPGHVLGGTIAIGVSEIIHYGAWPILLPALLPLYFAWDAHRVSTRRVGRNSRALDVARSADHGVFVVDDDCRVKTWNDAIARMLECPPAMAIGQPLVAAVPALAPTELPPALHETLRLRSPRSLARMTVKRGTSSRVLAVTVLPSAEGAIVICRDVTEQASWERSLRENAERFAIVSEAANDGVWELDLTTGGLFVSSRWRTMLGMPPGDARTMREAWLERVHADDLAVLQKSLGALANGEINRSELKYRLRHENGSYRSVVCRAVAVHDQSGRPVRLGGSVTDVTENAIALAKIHNAESRDALTGLLNRAAFVADVGRHLAEFRDRRGSRFAALYLDLDRFKVINDSLGHLVGDELLVEVSRRLEACLRPGDAIARLGGDEFAILLHGLGDEMQANVIAFRLQEALHTPFAIGGRDVVTSASIGIAFCREEYVSPEEIMRDADTAMYHAKAHGKARHELFDADMHARALDRLGLESDLRHAVKSSSFEVHYQPIVSLSNRMCTGFESLVRWNRNGKPVSPAEFVPMAEELGIIEPLGTWVMQEACRTFADWQQRFPQNKLECITVNVSARQLVQQGFIYLVEQVVEQNGMSPSDLRLEITETALMDAPQFAAQVLSELREFGVKIYLDDFGTGYSSLSHLHKLPVDALKIDRSFVRGLLMTDRPAIVESILALAQTLNTSVVAEGVEEENQASELERLGCPFAQGYYFSKPVSAEAIEAILTLGQPLGGMRATAPKPTRRVAAVRARNIA